jgi:hypothetical protein
MSNFIKFPILSLYTQPTQSDVHEILSSGSQVVSCRQTDGRTGGHNEAISRFSQISKNLKKNTQLC